MIYYKYVVAGELTALVCAGTSCLRKFQRNTTGALQKIPPSAENLFDGDMLAAYLQKIGGAEKLTACCQPTQQTGATTAATSQKRAFGTYYDNIPKPSTSKQASDFFEEILQHQKISSKVTRGHLASLSMPRPNQTTHQRVRNQILTRQIEIIAYDSRSFRGGCLEQYIHAWEKLGAPDHICKLLRGVRIPFVMKPPLIYPNQSIISNYRTKKSYHMT